MSKQQNERSDALFEALSKNKKRRRRKIIRTVITIVLLVALALVITVAVLRRRVTERFGPDAVEVLSYQATRDTISTIVTGSGVLSPVDLEQIKIPDGVEIEEVLVEEDAPVNVGDVLATVDMASVMKAMSELQTQLSELDEQISEAKDEEVSRYIEAGVDGRIKIVYAQVGDDVAGCMVAHGALAVLSLDGYMAVDITTDALENGDAVSVIREDGMKISGTVEKVFNGVATILVTDKGPRNDEEVTVTDAEGTVLGSGRLYIHAPLAVTGYAGTIQRVYARENDWAVDYTDLFYLKDTGYSANYETLIRQRGEIEAKLLELLALYRDGAILSPMDGLINSVDFNSDSGAAVSGGGAAASIPSSYAAYAGYTGGYSAAAAASAPSTSGSSGDGSVLVTIYPNISMSVTFGVDETDILALQVGQQADVTVSSVGGDSVYAGTVTEINKTASATSGVTQYSAVVTFDKVAGMLSGMTADVAVKITGAENVIVVPVDALHQTSTIHFVYTTYDAETQQYGGMKEVIIGMQNDKFVEITSGLAEGETVYYTETRTFNFMDLIAGMGGYGR